MKKRLLSLFAAFAVVLSLSACKPSETAQQTEETAAYNQSENIQNQALTFDDVNIIEINGKRVSLPFKVEDLGEEYSFDEVQGYQEKNPAIFYNNQCLAVVDLDNEKNIISMVFSSDALAQNDIKINNLSSNNSFEEIIDTIGVPKKQKELALIYEYDQGELYFGSEDGSLGFNYVKISLNEAPENAETTAPESSDVIYETLADGQERDWKIEDVLKNDLEIDGIPISLPCTVEELLEDLGSDYSISIQEVEENLDEDHVAVSLYYCGKNTYGYLMATVDSKNISFDNIVIDAYLDGIDNGVMSLSELAIGDSVDRCLKKYGKPNKVNVKGETTFLTYKDNGSFIQIDIKNNIVDGISLVGFETETEE